jgi:anti-sigma factor RsiW
VTEPTPPCPDDSVLLELALGELTGRDRADALAHVAGCHACRDEVAAIVATAEQLLLVAPEAEPPPGFESAVLERIAAGAPARRRRRWPVLAAAAAVVLAMLATLAVTTFSGGSGTELAEAAMTTPTGSTVGRAWRYDARPTWLLVSVPGWRGWVRTGAPDYHLRAELTGGRIVDLGSVTLGANGAWGTTTRVDAGRLRSVAIVDPTGRVWCTGTF